MKDGKIKLTDFGIAKDLDVAQLTATNNTVGTAAYMSPEQCRGERNLTHKSDLYSLGVVLYELLVGHKPFEAETTMDLFLAHVQGTFRASFQAGDGHSRLARQSRLPASGKESPISGPSMRPWSRRPCCRWPRRFRPSPAPASMPPRPASPIETASGQGSTPRIGRLPRNCVGVPKGKGNEAKTRKKRVFEQSWFQALGLAGMLVVVATLVYVAFRKPSPTALFEKVQKAMSSSDFDAKLRARSGPIEQFLRLYGKQDTAEGEQVQRWADEIDIAQREKTLANRMKAAMSPENDAEKQARDALMAEDKVEYAKAKEAWQKVRSSKEVATAEWRSLGLVADRHLRDLAKAEDDEESLREKIKLDMSADKFSSDSDTEPQLSATRALRFEGVGDFGQAKAAWEDIAKPSDLDSMRSWTYLARRKTKELTEKIEKLENKEPVPQRLAALDAYLVEVKELAKQRPAVAQTACKNVLDLYGKDKDPDVAERLNKFKNLATELAKKGRSS